MITGGPLKPFAIGQKIQMSLKTRQCSGVSGERVAIRQIEGEKKRRAQYAHLEKGINLPGEWNIPAHHVWFDAELRNALSEKEKCFCRVPIDRICCLKLPGVRIKHVSIRAANIHGREVWSGLRLGAEHLDMRKTLRTRKIKSDRAKRRVNEKIGNCTDPADRVRVALDAVVG